jgi:hypothetical protein
VRRILSHLQTHVLQDLSMGVNKLWQAALLASSRNLRQNVLKGRIWGPTADDEKLPFTTELYNSSSSSLDLPSSAPLLIQSADESVEKVRRPRRTRNGRVRGMVDSFERSGSFSSDSSFSDTGIDIGPAKRHIDEEAVVRSPIEADQEHYSSAVSSACSSPVRRPLPQPPVHPSLKDFFEEEPTMEELLESGGVAMTLKGDSWGAKAWEEIDRTANVTVKKVTSIGSKADDDDGLGIVGESKLWWSSRSKRTRSERRVVTSIFSPSTTGTNPAEVDELLTAEEGQLEEQVRTTSALLEAFKNRLEEVEQRVCEMEEAEKQLQQELSLRVLENDELQRKLRGEKQALGKEAPSFHDKNETIKRKAPNNLDPQSIPALSQYVILVGLGVCAVVLRVVLRKVIGKKLKL